MDSKYLNSFHYVVKSEKFSAAVDSILRSPLVAICDPQRVISTTCQDPWQLLPYTGYTPPPNL